MAVNVTLVPVQIAPAGSLLTLMPTITFGVTDIEIEFEVAGLPVTQVAFEVIIQLIKSLFTNVALLYVTLLVPVFAPFFFH